MSTLWDFASLTSMEPDPIFAMTAKAQAAGSSAINGTIGVYMDEHGAPLVFPSVKAALRDLGENLESLQCGYPPLTGLPQFHTAVMNVLFDESYHDHIAGCATTAGTGALAMNLRLAQILRPDAVVMLQTPAWINHLPLCRAQGLEVRQMPYLDTEGNPDVRSLAEACSSCDRPIILLLQASCHNPTGRDFTDAQWQEIIELALRHDALILLDIAYQGLKGTPEEDRIVVTRCLETSLPLLVTWSASKNHSIYALRTGYACAIARDEAIRANIALHYSRITRGMYSAAPTFGQMIVAHVQQKYGEQWRKDLTDAREMIGRKRRKMKDLLPASWHAALSGHGMFAMLPLRAEQVKALQSKNVFLANDGRLNIAGVAQSRIEEMCEAIQSMTSAD